MRQLINTERDYTWLNRAACAPLKLNLFFVEAGHVIDEETLDVCRGCPVRVECVTHAYDGGWVQGYFGGLSPGQRRQLKTLEEALAFIANDPPRRALEPTEPESAEVQAEPESAEVPAAVVPAEMPAPVRGRRAPHRAPRAPHV